MYNAVINRQADLTGDVMGLSLGIGPIEIPGILVWAVVGLDVGEIWKKRK